MYNLTSIYMPICHMQRGREKERETDKDRDRDKG